MLTLMMQKTQSYSVNDLCSIIGCDRRTIYRYIKAFNEAGFVVLTDHHHVRLATNTAVEKQLSELLYFNEEEALTLYNAIDSIETDNQLRTDLKSKLTSLYGSHVITEKLMRMEKNMVSRRLREAIEGRHRATLVNYSSPSSNTTKNRLVEPFALTEDGKFVWAFEVESEKNKIFSLSRIERVKVSERMWLNSRKHQQGYIDDFRIISFDGSTKNVKLRLNRLAYNLLTEEHPGTEKRIQKDPESDEWIYEAPVSNYKGIGRFVAGLADCIKIESPGLQRYIADYAREFMLLD